MFPFIVPSSHLLLWGYYFGDIVWGGTNCFHSLFIPVSQSWHYRTCSGSCGGQGGWREEWGGERHCSVHCRTFNSIIGLYLPDVSSIHIQVVTTKCLQVLPNVSERKAKLLILRTTALYTILLMWDHIWSSHGRAALPYLRRVISLPDRPASYHPLVPALANWLTRLCQSTTGTTEHQRRALVT